MCDQIVKNSLTEIEEGRKVVELHSPAGDKSGKLKLKESEGKWIDTSAQEAITILDPDDALMKRFQDALRKHLTRVDNQLSTEIRDFEAEIKHAEKQHEKESVLLYDSQQKIVHQQTTIEKYQGMLLKIMSMREEKEQHIKEVKELHKNAYNQLQDEKGKEKKCVEQLKRLSRMQDQFSKWEKELANCLNVSQRMSKKDSITQKELIKKKQEKDYILWKLMDEVWKLESEMSNLYEQLKLKNNEKSNTAQLVTDASADLEALYREHANLYTAWNSVIDNISKRDKVFCDLNAEREKVRESSDAVQFEIEKIKKDTAKEMQNNEHLTSLHLRIENDIRVASKIIDGKREKINNLERQSAQIVKYGEQTQRVYESVNADYQYYLNQEEQVDKEFAKLVNDKNELENRIFDKLDDKVMYNKAAKYLNKLLLSRKRSIQEQELLVAQTENAYAKNLLELERLNGYISNEKLELDEFLQKNLEKHTEIDDMQKKAEKYNLIIGRKQSKIVNLNKIIDQVSANTGGQDISPQELKIISLKKNIEEVELKNQKAQQFWLRQENLLISLNQQKDSQLQELSRLSKKMMIMEQKNYKMEFELEKFSKEEANMDRKLNLLQQELRQINANFVAQKDLKNELEDQNSITKNMYIKNVQDSELELIKLQSDTRELENEKLSLKDKLKSLQQESLSWEKKVQLAYETTKKMKDERNIGGDIAEMKSEIHKMEMRLSHLKRVQEKLINDMEYCVARREVILNKTIGKFRKDPRTQHHQKFVFYKRLEDQKLKTRQIYKEIKQVENNIVELQDEKENKLQLLDEEQNALRIIEDVIPDIDKQIMELEFIKYHNLKVLVFKQRKVKLLQDIKSGRYKSIFKSESVLNEELQNERMLHSHLKEIMERTMQDFPLLKNDIRRIQLTLQIL